MSAGWKEGVLKSPHESKIYSEFSHLYDKIFSRFPDAAGREDSLISIEGIVDAFAFLYRQPERAWSFELDVRTSKEKW